MEEKQNMNKKKQMTINLIAAARNFDESRGFKFISYAVWWIRNSMLWAVEQRTNYSF